jgi:general secretion pathway protein J
MNNRGFTLLEIMIAVTVFALLATLAARVLESVLTTEQKLHHTTSELRQLQLTASLIEHDLLHFSLTNYPPQSLTPPLLAKKDSLCITTSLSDYPFAAHRATTQRVTYRLLDGNFIRQTLSATEPQQRVLLHDVQLLRFHYLSINNHWLNELNPHPIRTIDRLTLRYLPKLVKLTLRTKAWGDLEFILPLGPRVYTL